MKLTPFAKLFITVVVLGVLGYAFWHYKGDTVRQWAGAEKGAAAEKSGGVGAALLRRGRCTGCQLEATAADLVRYRAAAADEVLRCEECNRILVRTAESGL